MKLAEVIIGVTQGGGLGCKVQLTPGQVPDNIRHEGIAQMGLWWSWFWVVELWQPCRCCQWCSLHQHWGDVNIESVQCTQTDNSDEWGIHYVSWVKFHQSPSTAVFKERYLTSRTRWAQFSHAEQRRNLLVWTFDFDFPFSTVSWWITALVCPMQLTSPWFNERFPQWKHPDYGIKYEKC